MDVFPFFEKKKIWKKEKFNALKQLDLVAADTEDILEFAVEEETAS
jgi:hypothetical protein